MVSTPATVASTALAPATVLGSTAGTGFFPADARRPSDGPAATASGLGFGVSSAVTRLVTSRGLGGARLESIGLSWGEGVEAGPAGSWEEAASPARATSSRETRRRCERDVLG